MRKSDLLYGVSKRQRQITLYRQDQDRIVSALAELRAIATRYCTDLAICIDSNACNWGFAFVNQKRLVNVRINVEIRVNMHKAFDKMVPAARYNI